MVELAGRFRHYPLGHFKTPRGVDDARAWAIADAAAEGFGGDHPSVEFYPNAPKYLDGYERVDNVGWVVRAGK